jgi:hypothetical protein
MASSSPASIGEDDASNWSWRLATFTYDEAGRRSGLASGGTASAFRYDEAGRLARLAHNLAGPYSDQAIALTYNPAGQILARTASKMKMPISQGNHERGAQVMVDKGDGSLVAEVRTGKAAGHADPDNPMSFHFKPVLPSDKYNLGADAHPQPRQLDRDEKNIGVRSAQQVMDQRNRYPSRGDYEHMNKTNAPMFNRNTSGAITETYRTGGVYHTAVVSPGSGPLGPVPDDLSNVVADPQ